MGKHTPGPWAISEGRKLRQEASCGSVPIKSPGNDLALCSVATYQRESGEWEANARLIAAAPDLLAALKNLACPAHFGSRCLDRDYQMALAAIAKADGR